MISNKLLSYLSWKLFSKVSSNERSVLLNTISTIATFDMDDYSDDNFDSYIQLILEKFPKYEDDRVFRRVKYPYEINGPEDEFFLIAFTSSHHRTVWILYSYLNVYLLAVLVGDEKIYVLDEKDFKFPARLLVGLERVNVNCGLSYTQLPPRHEVCYSPTLICHSIFILSLGYTEKRSKEWKQGIVRAIGITSESLRFHWMRDLIKRTSDVNIYATETPSAEVVKIMNNWDKVSYSVRSGSPFKFGTRTYPHYTLCTIVSLLNHNDGTEMKNAEKSLNKCAPLSCNEGTEMEDLENSLNKGFLVPHHRICPRRVNDDNFLSRVPSSISDMSGTPLKPITKTYSHGMAGMVFSPLTHNDGFEMENSLNGKGSLERSICLTGAITGTKELQHSYFRRRANDSDVLSRVLSSISYGSGKPSKLITNIDSHGISCTVSSPLTRNVGTEMENSWNGMGSLVPQHIICPRRANAGIFICPRRANAVHSTPLFFPARAYRCPRSLYSNCLISASRMMMFFMHHR